MATTTISKISGVVFIAQGTQNATSYFNKTGNFQFDDADANVTITMGLTSFTNVWGNFIVAGQVPSTPSELNTLLTSIFGT